MCNQFLRLTRWHLVVKNCIQNDKVVGIKRKIALCGKLKQIKELLIDHLPLQ